MQYSLVIFDLDGTLLDTLTDLHASINYALRQSGFPVRTLEQVRQAVGNGIWLLVTRSVPPDTTEAQCRQVYDDFRTHYRDHCVDTTAPYPGIPSLLEALHAAGCRSAMVSNKADFAVQLLAEEYFPRCFDAVLGEQPGIPKKPAPHMVQRVLEQLGIPASQAVYVGDSQVDVETAQNAGLPCISVSWGFRTRAELLAAGAGPIISQPMELLTLLGL